MAADHLHPSIPTKPEPKDPEPNSSVSIAIIGGGISSLAAGFYLRRWKPNWRISIFEASSRFGGAIGTEIRDGFLIERSADMFVRRPEHATELCHDLGILDQLIPPSTTNRFSSVLRDGKLIRIPAGFSLLSPNRLDSVLRSPVFSLRGKARFLLDWFCRPGERPDEDLKSFAVRHFGTEFFERLIQPLVAGVYSAKANELSMQATLHRFVEMEREYGSLIKAARRQVGDVESDRNSSGARYGMFVTPRQGMQSLIDELTSQLSGADLRPGCPVLSLKRRNDKWNVATGDESRPFDGVMLGTNARISANLLQSIDKELSRNLESIAFGTLIVVALGCSNESFANRLPEGYGFVIPEIERKNLIAVSYSSNKFPDRAPAGKNLLRCFVGGNAVEKLANATDKQIISIIEDELSEILGYRQHRSDWFQVIRWQHCMPQYRVGHGALVDRIEKLVSNHHGIQINGCCYHGVGIPACIQSGKQAAQKLINQITNSKPNSVSQ